MIKTQFTIFFFTTFLLLYLSWAIVLAYKYSSKYSYHPNYNSFFIKIATGLTQPIMEAFGNRKVTHFWHWQTFTPGSDYTRFGLKRDGENRRVLQPGFDLSSLLTNAKADLNGIKEVIVVKPVDYEGSWSLAYCVEGIKLFCQKSTITFKGEVKILNDGIGYTWGLDDQEKPIKLEILREIKADQERDLLFV